MEDEGKPTEDLSSLLEAIKSSNDLERKTMLIYQLEESCKLAPDGVSLLVECLPTLWADASTMGECTLNKAIIHVSTKFFELNASCCVSHFLILATKACSWSVKHLEMPNSSTAESQPDHFDLLSQLVMDSLRFSSLMNTALATSLFEEKVLQLIVESFVLGEMNLMKSLIAEFKKIHPVLSPVMKAMLTTLDTVIKLSKTYIDRVKHDATAVSKEYNPGSVDGEMQNHHDHVMNLTICIIHNLHDLGVIAASGGGNLVTLLNASWKGVVSLLQLGKGVLSDKINAGDIIISLITLALEALRLITDTWSHELNNKLSLVEVKRSVLPVKFFLVNAVRIYSEYPCQAMKVCCVAAKCALKVSCLGISFSREENLRAASEALAEVLEPTSFLLLCSILNSANVKHDVKLYLLDSLFTEDAELRSTLFDKDADFAMQQMQEISKVVHEEITDAATLKMGKLILLLNFLKSSVHLKEEIVFVLSRKLGFILSCLVNEEVYACSLVMQAPLSSCGGRTAGVVWQTIIIYLIHCFKIFMIVTTSFESAWNEVQYFLYENLFHPHMLCVEIVIQLWCFLIRNAPKDTVDTLLDNFCLLLKTICPSEPSLAPFSDERKMARSIAIIISCAPQNSIDRLYSSFIADGKSKLSLSMHVALLMEGFPLDLLSENVKNDYFQNIQDMFFKFLGNNYREFSLLSSTGSSGSAVFGLPVHALACWLQHCQIGNPEIFDKKTASQLLNFVISVIRECSAASDALKESYGVILSSLLGIISNSKVLYTFEDMGKVVLELQKLYLPEPVASNAISYQCKASLSSFMASLCHMEIEETDANSVCCAAWALFHVLLKERHWAFIHLALVAFGYFTARTSCSELWRFLPNDASLSYDLETGSTACEEMFMTEFKMFLEKEIRSDVMDSFKAQYDFLKAEGAILREKAAEISSYKADVTELKMSTSKKRKMPDGVKHGLGMLQSGLKALNDAFACDVAAELKEEFSTHISCLEDVVNHLFHLSNRD